MPRPVLVYEMQADEALGYHADEEACAYYNQLATQARQRLRRVREQLRAQAQRN